MKTNIQSFAYMCENISIGRTFDDFFFLCAFHDRHKMLSETEISSTTKRACIFVASKKIRIRAMDDLSPDRQYFGSYLSR